MLECILAYSRLLTHNHLSQDLAPSSFATAHNLKSQGTGLTFSYSQLGLDSAVQREKGGALTIHLPLSTTHSP